MTEEQWKTFSGEQFTGFDTDQTMVRISAMNLLLHSIDHPDIRNQDSLSHLNTIRDKFDLILANPPFTGSVDVEDIDDSLKAVVETKQTELLFVALFLRMLKLGGRCVCIVPNGVLFRSNSKAYRQLRAELVDNQRFEAIIYMPSGVFKPYSGVSTAILVFTKTDAGGTDKVWLYNMEGDGYTLDDKRDSDEKHNDIPDILERWGNLDTEEQRARTDKSFLVPKSEIVENDYDFSFNKYAETKYERIEYPPTEEILADLDDLNRQMTESLAELHKMLGGGQQIQQELSHAVLFNMVELTVQSLKAQNIKKAGLLATDGTIAGGVFKESLKNAGIESVLPGALSQKSLMALIYRIKAGKEPDMAAFNRILQELVSGGAERIVLGCTEISILNLKEKCPCAVPYTDCMELLAEAAVAACSGQVAQK